MGWKFLIGMAPAVISAREVTTTISFPARDARGGHFADRIGDPVYVLERIGKPRPFHGFARPAGSWPAIGCETPLSQRRSGVWLWNA